MPQRDYAARERNQRSSGGNKKWILLTIALLLLCAGLALMLLKTYAPAVETTQQKSATSKLKTELPSRPEETFNYIRELETREVPVDQNSRSKDKMAVLTAEQERLLKQQQEEEKRKQEEARLAAEKAAQQAAQQAANQAAQPTTTEENATIKALTPEEFAAKQAQEKKLAEQKKAAEEKRKQQQLAEAKKAKEAVKKPQEVVATTDSSSLDAAKAAESKKAETAKAKAEPAKKEPAKIVATAAKPNDKAPNQAGRFGLQCGAYKNQAQAENMQARLAMAGFNARISSSDYHRVLIGPVGNRAEVSAAQSNARSVAECMIVAM